MLMNCSSLLRVLKVIQPRTTSERIDLRGQMVSPTCVLACKNNSDTG